MDEKISPLPAGYEGIDSVCSDCWDLLGDGGARVDDDLVPDSYRMVCEPCREQNGRETDEAN